MAGFSKYTLTISPDSSAFKKDGNWHMETAFTCLELTEKQEQNMDS